MKTTATRPRNDRLLDRLRQVFAELLAETCRHGYYGTATLELRIADGTIQEIRRKTERVHR